MTGFYMVATLAFNELKKKSYRKKISWEDKISLATINFHDTFFPQLFLPLKFSKSYYICALSMSYVDNLSVMANLTP